MARRQGALALELHAAISLARLWAEDGQVTRAIGLLLPVHASFSEGFATADLVRAQALLEELARLPST